MDTAILFYEIRLQHPILTGRLEVPYFKNYPVPKAPIKVNRKQQLRIHLTAYS